MRKETKLFFTAAMAFLTLAGCNNPAPKQPHVVKETASYTIVFDGNRAQLSAAEFKAFDAFVQTVPASAVTYAGITADENISSSLTRAKHVRTYLIKQGVPREAIHIQPAADSDPQSIGLLIEYAKALPPEPCPDWSKNSIANYNNTEMSNFGCAYYNNLAVQMVNPADYDRGHGVAEFNGDRDSVGLQKYMLAVPAATAGASAGASSSAGGASSQ